MAIHPTAIIDPKAELADDLEIGAHAVIEGCVRIGSGTRIYPNAFISGWTEIGANCQIHPGAVVGHLPQDFHFSGERSYCRIGDGTIIREFASVHRGTQPESATVIGKNCFILGYSHIGHNCTFGDGVKLYNMAACSGHVEAGNNAIISGHSVIHQFVRIGDLAMIGGRSRVTMDVPPYFTCVHETECVGINAVGLRRAGFSSESINDVKAAYRTLYRSGMPFRKAVAELAEVVSTEAGQRILDFVSSPSKRGYAGGPAHRRGEGTPPDIAGAGE